MNLTYLEIDNQRAVYNTLIEAPPELEFVDALLFSWLFHDHSIEGVVLDPEAIRRALTNRPSRNYKDRQIKHSLNRQREIAMSMLDGTRKNDKIDLLWLREIHMLLSTPNSENAGRYRTRDTTPGVYNLKCVKGSTVSYHLQKLFDSVEDIIENEHPIRAAAKIHWEFMQIFPFDEYSGFVGRLLMNQILTQAGYPPAIFHQMDRQNYFDALDTKSSRLIPVVLEGIKSTLDAAQHFYDNSQMIRAAY